jgi:hypothetical protein
MAIYYLSNSKDTLNTAATAYYLKSTANKTSQSNTLSLPATTGVVTTLYDTEAYLPRQAAWGTPTITMTLQVTASGTLVAGSIAVKNLTTGQTGTFGTSVAMTAAGTFTMTAGALAFTGTSVTDRLQVQLKVTNTAAAIRTFTYTVNTSVSGSSVNSGITEFSDAPGLAEPAAQYAADRATLVAVGASSGTDGGSTNLYLEQNISSYGIGYNTSVSFEDIGAASSYTNVATKTTNLVPFRTGQLLTARRGGSMGYDAKNKRILEFGGYDGTNRFNELWQLDTSQIHARWKILAPTGGTPSVRNLTGTACITLNNKTWLINFGGSTAAGADDGTLNICEVSTPGSEVWTVVTQTNAPAARSYMMNHLVIVPTSTTAADVYIFGGWGSARFNDLYKFSLNMASTVPTTVTWTTLKANLTAGNPQIRSGAFVVYDSNNARLLICAGFDGTTYFNDIWQYSIAGNAFTQLTATNTYVGRELPSGGYDVNNKRIILFGGWTSATAATGRNDVIQIDLTTPNTPVNSTLKINDGTNADTVGFSSGGSTVDTDKQLIVQWGQNAVDTTDKYTYAFDLSSTAATNNHLYGLNVQDHFRGRDAPAYCYDPNQGVLAIINGFTGMDDDTTASIPNGDHHNEFWTYNYSTNKLKYASKGYFGMVDKEGVCAVYDTTANRIISFGGITGNGQTSSDAWEHKADAAGNYSARLMAPTGTPPPSRWLCAMAYDPTRNRVIIWGGENSTTVFNTCYILDLSGGGDGAWSAVTPTGTVPTAVWQPGFCRDSTNNRLYVYSGASNQAGTTFSSQAFYIDMSAATLSYTILTATGNVARRGKALDFDAANGQVIAFGGYDGTSVYNELQFLNIASPTAWVTATPAISPNARRSTAHTFMNGKMYLGAGREQAGQFFSDMWELTPNYVTPTSSTWVNKNPGVYQRFNVPITGQANGNYQWQGWATTNAILTAKTNYAGAANSVAYILGSAAVSGVSSLTLLGVG